ncbi:MAG TPA: four helix bundle protein [Panacibacter sp.]|nr:four helix bundle protein [Panacibacter sp.]
MRDYHKYEVWQKAHELTLYVYKEIIPLFPASEKYELVSQIKRAAYSVPMNIAEGCGRNTHNDFVHFLDMSLGSLHEIEYCSLLAKDLSYIDTKSFESLYEKVNIVKAKLINLIKSIRK